MIDVCVAIVNSGIGESWDRGLFSLSDVIDSDEDLLRSITMSSHKSFRTSVSDSIDSGDSDI